MVEPVDSFKPKFSLSPVDPEVLPCNGQGSPTGPGRIPGDVQGQQLHLMILVSPFHLGTPHDPVILGIPALCFPQALLEHRALSFPSPGIPSVSEGSMGLLLPWPTPENSSRTVSAGSRKDLSANKRVDTTGSHILQRDEGKPQLFISFWSLHCPTEGLMNICHFCTPHLPTEKVWGAFWGGSNSLKRTNYPCLATIMFHLAASHPPARLVA